MQPLEAEKSLRHAELGPTQGSDDYNEESGIDELEDDSIGDGTIEMSGTFRDKMISIVLKDRLGLSSP